VHNLRLANSLLLKILVVLQFIVADSPVLLGWAMVFVHTGVLLASALLTFEHALEMDSREDTVMRDNVVLWRRLEIVQVFELGRVALSEQKWHVNISIIDSVHFLAIKEAEDVVLDDRVLGLGCCHRPGGWEADSVTKRENVLKLLVLKCVFVDIDHAFVVGQT